MRKLVAMQPYFLPYGGYFSLLRAADEVVFLDEDQYVPRRWMNRCMIESNSKYLWLTLPVDGSEGTRRPLNEIRLASDNRDFKSAERTFDRLTQQSPLLSSRPLTQRMQDTKNLARFNISLIAEVFESLFNEQLDYKVQSEMSDLPEFSDFQARAISISKRLGCDSYLNASGGRDLYSQSRFKDSGVSLYFMDPYAMDDKDKLSLASMTGGLIEIRARVIQGVNFR